MQSNLKPSTSSDVPTSSNSCLTTTSTCAVCSAPATCRRYGALSCLGCSVFFRRSVLHKMTYKCQRKGTCQVTVETRCVCRYCRMQKCLAVGMSPDEIKLRDIIGPRKPKPPRQLSHSMDRKDMSDQTGTSSSIPLQSFLITPSISHPPTSSKSIISTSKETFDMDTFRQLQRSQWDDHASYYLEDENLSEGCVFMQRTRNYHRRARSADVNLAFKLSIENSRSWAAKFPLLYDNLTEEQRKWIFSEYSIGFMIIDQALRTKDDADDGFWLLQNGSFLGLHPDFQFEILEGRDKEKQEEIDKSHFSFVTQLLNTIVKPFKTLQVNVFESIMLKNLLFFTCNLDVFLPSIIIDTFLDCTIFFESNPYYSHCMDLFMEHTSANKLGETVLLIRSIRCAIILVYNITKQSELFSITNFDQVVKDVLAD